MAFHRACEHGFLNLGSMLKKLLDYLWSRMSTNGLSPEEKRIFTDIVAENILNQLKSGVGDNLLKEHLLFLSRGCLKLLLDKSRSMLVSTKLDNITEYVLR